MNNQMTKIYWNKFIRIIIGFSNEYSTNNRHSCDLTTCEKLHFFFCCYCCYYSFITIQLLQIKSFSIVIVTLFAILRDQQNCFLSTLNRRPLCWDATFGRWRIERGWKVNRTIILTLQFWSPSKNHLIKFFYKP